MKKQLFIILSIFLFTANANANAASEYNNVLHEASNLEFGLQSSVYSNSGILNGSPELGRIGRAIVHMGHRKFWTHSATQNGITYLSWIAPVGKGVTLLSNIIRTGAKLITKQAVKGGTKLYSDAMFKAFERQLARDGIKSILKTQSSIQKNLAEHIQKLGKIKLDGGYSSSVEREIKTFQSQLDAIKDLLK